MKSPISIIILAAGKGVRMKSELPKVMHKIKGKPMIIRVVEITKKLDVKKTVIVVGYKKDIVQKALKNFDSVSFVEQNKQNGTGHAVMMTEREFTDFHGNIVVLPGDVPLLKAKTIKNLIKTHVQNNAAATVLTAKLDNPKGYGRIIRDRDGFVEKIVEQKDATEEEKTVNEINSGIFCFDSKKLFQTLPFINNNNSQNELYLTDTLEIFKNKGYKIAAVVAENPIEISGINSQKQLEKLESILE